jgi:hypothetical protein
MQSALKEGTINENDIVCCVEVSYFLAGGVYPISMKIPLLNKYFEETNEVKDACLRDQCTVECVFCDCTHNIRAGCTIDHYCHDRSNSSYEK